MILRRFGQRFSSLKVCVARFEVVFRWGNVRLGLFRPSPVGLDAPICVRDGEKREVWRIWHGRLLHA